MHTTQIALVQSSFRAIEANADTLADLFYARLFALQPALREMFSPNAAAQKRKLLDMLNLIVRGLDQVDTLLPMVRELGARHTGYGVQASYYAVVETALLWALEVVLAERFTLPVRNAWRETYALLARTMQETAPSAGGARAR